MNIEDIKQLQQFLINFGLVDPPVDGILGKQTSKAVNLFAKLYKTEATKEAVFAKIKDLNVPDIKPANYFVERTICEIQRNKFWLSRGIDAPNIVYIEGANMDGSTNKNKINYWNDLRTLLVIEHNGKAYFKDVWQGTVNSGKYYTENPMRIEGAANIEIPLQTWAWQVGRHITRSLNEEALVQVKPVPVRRDKDKDGRDQNDKLQDFEVIGLNQHSGRGETVDKWSASCLVVNSQEAQINFMTECKSHRAYKVDKSYVFSSILLLNEFLN